MVIKLRLTRIGKYIARLRSKAGREKHVLYILYKLKTPAKFQFSKEIYLDWPTWV